MRGKKTDLAQAGCAIARSLSVIGDWWTLLIVRDALVGSTRFSEFHENIGLAKNILSSRLKKLVEGKILTIEEDSASPLVRRYVLTSRGRQLAVVVVALWQWGEEHCFSPGKLEYSLADGASDRMLAKMEIKTTDGRRIDPSNLQMTMKWKGK
jgi:DNA-binding HxlR family transcriptional regulator